MTFTIQLKTCTAIGQSARDIIDYMIPKEDQELRRQEIRQIVRHLEMLDRYETTAVHGFTIQRTT